MYLLFHFSNHEQTPQPEATSHLLRAKGRFPPIGGLGIKHPRPIHVTTKPKT